MREKTANRILIYILVLSVIAASSWGITFNVYADSTVSLLTAEIDTVKELISKCEEREISTDYERVYLSAVERSVEIMHESSVSEDFIAYNQPICTELLSKAKTSLTGYLDGSITPYDVPKINPEGVAVNGKNLVGTVSDGGIEYSSPVFLNGYNLGWENRDDSDFLSQVGVNNIPYTININRVIGRPNTAYKWTPSGKAATGGEMFAPADDSSLKIVGDGSTTGMIYQMVSLTEGKEYTVKFRAKGETSGNVYIRIGTSGNTDVQFSIPASSDWAGYEYTYTPTATCKPEFRINCVGSVTGAYIDDVSLTDENGDELLTNGGFEEWFDSGVNSDEGLFGINAYALETGRQTLEYYKSKGYTVVLSGGFASMPTYVLSMNGVKDADASYGSYFPYNPTHPMIFGAIKTYLTAVLPIARECGNVVCFMIHNEPSFNSYGKSFYTDKWKDYLERKYSYIADLNLAYGGTQYADFADVPMQNTENLTAAEKLTGQYYDWRVFNDSIITEYHNVIKGYIEDIAPDIPAGTKVMQEVAPRAALVQHYGTDYEAFGVNMDINANDGWARPDAVGQTIQAQMMWYDFQTSVNEAPVFNMENHFALDKNTLNYTENYADWVTAMLWQGAMHGLSGSQAWLWGRNDEEYPNFINTTVQYRADVMAQIGKTGLDINRLAEEITAFREKTAESAILFSETSKSYNRQYENALYQSYLGAMYSGVKTDLICESKISRLAEYNMLIIPEATHVTDAVVDEIHSFVQKGGKVLMLAEDCLKYNAAGQERTNLTKVNAIKAAAVTESGGTRNFTGSSSASVSDIESKVKAFYKARGAAEIELTDENNNPVTGIEISTAENSGRILINLCSYNTENLSVYVKYNDSMLSGMTNLIDSSTYEGLVTLKPNVPVLLAVDGGTAFGVGKPTFGKMEFGENPFSPDGSGGTASERNIKSLSAGNIFAAVDIYNCGSTDDIILVMAVKNRDIIKSVSAVRAELLTGSNSEIIVVDANNLTYGDYLELFVWSSDGLIPLTGTCKLK